MHPCIKIWQRQIAISLQCTTKLVIGMVDLLVLCSIVNLFITYVSISE